MKKISKGALAKDPPKTQSSQAAKSSVKTAQAAYNKAKVALRNAAPGSAEYANLQKAFKDASRKAGVSAGTVNDLIKKYGSGGGAPTQGTTPQGAGPQGAEPMTPEAAARTTITGGGEAYRDILDRFRGGLNQPPQDFTAEMERARQDVRSQFDRRNAEAFAREREATQQSILERGLDPNSPAAQALVRDMNDRQDRARQEAESAAEQAAYNVQSQGFGQNVAMAKLPFEQFSQISAPFQQGLQSQYDQADAAEKFRQAQELARQQFGYDIKKIQTANKGAGQADASAAEQAFAQYMMSQYQNQNQPRPNPGAAFGQGFAQGAGGSISNVLQKRSGA